MLKIRPDFSRKNAITESILFTVAMRAFDARSKQPVLGDSKSLELLDKIDYDFERFSQGTTMSRLSISLRAKYFDECARKFIAKYEHPVVVLLGCGLDTRYFRLGGDVAAVFYEVDFPEIIAFRKQLLPASANDRLMGCSIFDSQCLERIKAAHPRGDFLFIGEGVLMCFVEERARAFLGALVDNFPGAHICCDVLSRWACKNSQYHDILGYGRPCFEWGIDSDQKLCSWHRDLRIISSQSTVRCIGKYHFPSWILGFLPLFRDASRILCLWVPRR